MARGGRSNDEPRPLMSDEDHRAELLGVFKLEPDDLVANRAGKLSDRERAKLVRSGSINLGLAIFMALVLVGILGTVASHPLKPVQYVLGALCVLALAVVGSGEFRKCRAAASAGIVVGLSGPVQVHLRSRTGWFLSVEGQTFRLPIRGWHVGSGKSYHVYIAPAAKRIIAMEPA